MTILIAIGAVVLLVALAYPSRAAKHSSALPTPQGDGPLTTAAGLLGATGASVGAAAAVGLRIDLFEKQHGRKPTDAEIATIVGMMDGLNP